MGFSVFRACMTVAFCLMLLALFFFPSHMLRGFADAVEDHIRLAEDALLRQDVASAERECRILTGMMDENMLALERFLNHASVDALGSAFEIAFAAARIGDTSAAFEALADAGSALDRLRGIELFSPNSLL